MAKGHKPRAPLLPADPGEHYGTMNGDDHTSEAVKSLTRQVIEQRIIRLTRQNRKLEFDIQRHEHQYGDIEQMKQVVLRCNAVVKQSFFGMASRIASQLTLMTEEAEIQQFLLVQFTQAFNDLAYEHGGRTPPDA